MSHTRTQFAVLLLALFLTGVPLALAESMQSETYRIQFDSLNMGGNESTSSTYRLGDTLGEAGTGESGSTTYTLRAGYRQMTAVYLALAPAADVTMDPALGGISGGESDGITYATATTDGTGGYALFISASNAPALQGESTDDTIADYAPGDDPSYDLTYAAAEALFAFSPEGVDSAARYKNSGTTCATGSSDDAAKCWDGLSASDRTIATRTSANHPLGTQTTLRFKVGIGGSAHKTADTYRATTTLTLIAL